MSWCFANAGEAREDEKLNCLLLILLGDNKLITALIPSLYRDAVVQLNATCTSPHNLQYKCTLWS